MAFNGNQTDAMVQRLEKEIEERDSFIQGVTGGAQDTERDLTPSERELISEARNRIVICEEQLESLYEARSRTAKARTRAAEVQKELTRVRTEVDNGPVEYRSAGAYILDQYKASLNDRDARDRLETFARAAAHQKTSDNLGVIADPVVGDVVNFIDGSRPIVSALGVLPMPSANWHRPKVTQHTSVAKQGSNGAAADEKTELVSQKMTITRLDGSAVTYGGYVNVSRQNIDFSSPSSFDAVVNDLALQYAIQTEAAVGAVIGGASNTVELAGTAGAPSVDNLLAGLWTAVGNVYNATKGAGRVFIAITPAQLAVFGPLLSPWTKNDDGRAMGFNAGSFSMGTVGNISGIPVIMSAGLSSVTNDWGVVASTAAVEVYEQRVGTLQVTEPSVLGVQVAYAGYFTPMTIESAGLQRLINVA